MGKKLVAIIVLVITLGLVVPHLVLAQTYDGLWMSPMSADVFAILVEDGSLLLGVLFDLKSGGYSVLVGPLMKGTAQLQNVYPSIFKAVLTLTFTSPTNASFVLNSCTGICPSFGLPIGVPIPVVRPWPTAK